MKVIPIDGLLGVQSVNASISKEVSEQDISGVLLIFESYTTIPKCNVSAVLRTAEAGTIQLLPSMPLLPLVERADFHGGASYTAHLEKAIGSTADAGEAYEIDQLSVFLSFGHIKVGGDDEIEFNLSVGTAFGAADGVSAAFLDLGLGDESIHAVTENSGSNAVFSDPEEVWLYETAAPGTNEKDLAALTSGQLTVGLKTGNDSSSFDARYCWALTSALGRFEVSSPRRTALVYADRFNSNPSQKVAVALTGTLRASYSLFAVERVTVPSRVRSKKQEVLSEAAAASDRILVADSSRHAALVLQGRIATPGTYRTLLGRL